MRIIGDGLFFYVQGRVRQQISVVTHYIGKTFFTAASISPNSIRPGC
jgi:hypothetical protein